MSEIQIKAEHLPAVVGTYLKLVSDVSDLRAERDRYLSALETIRMDVEDVNKNANSMFSMGRLQNIVDNAIRAGREHAR